jgi:hypothetical protein
VLVADDLQSPANRLEQLAGCEQKRGIARAAVRLVAARKGLVQQHAALADRIEQPRP